jgi:hypothetical protein
MTRSGISPIPVRIGPGICSRSFWQNESSGRWWFIAAPEDDPLIRTNGQLDVPAPIAELFTRLERDCFDPDEIRIGHEFPAGVDPRSVVIAQRRPHPPAVRDMAHGAS